MNLLYSSSQFAPFRSFRRSFKPFPNPSLRFFTIRSSSLPSSIQEAKYHKELEAAVDVVERACRLCVDVKTSLFSSDGRILEKNDQTPVTIADFGVQALVSLELGKLFPAIPLVAEEDSSFLRSNNLVDLVTNEVADKTIFGDKSLTDADVLEAIDRGGKDAFEFGAKPATYWVLDPIDGTRGFLKGSDALYVVGLALVVEGEIVLGIMGCPNWPEDFSEKSTTGSGSIMISHVGCGTWTKRLADILGSSAKMPDYWTRCFVDGCCIVHEARFCISDSQTWDSLPLSALFNAKTNTDVIEDEDIVLLSTCCGSLCKYLMVASGRASVFILRARAQRIMKTWDHAVGVICVREAGGKVTDWRGSQLDLAADQVERRVLYPSGGVLVTNGNLHNGILDMISSHSSETKLSLSLSLHLSLSLSKIYYTTMGRAPCCDKDGLKKGPWTPEEDQKLIDYIQKHGCGNWRTLPKNAGLQRCGKSCRLRWTNYLRPDIKRGRFSFEEEETIIQLHSILGNKWSAIAARLPGRTDNEIKNYWNTHIRKRLLRMGIDPVTHSPRLDLLDLSSILNSTLYNNSSQVNMSRLLGVQPFINPELLRLATSLLSSSQQCENQNPNFFLHNQNQVLCNNNTSQFQNQVFQTPNHQIQQVVPSGYTTFGTDQEAQLMDPINIEDQFTNFDDQWQQQQQQNEEQDRYVPVLPGYGYYDSNQSTIMGLPQSDNGNNQNFSFASVLSTPSSSPTPMNSNSTYINGSGTEDEKESYCSSINMLKFELPDMLDVNHFM